MSQEEVKESADYQRKAGVKGRTWADVFVSASYIGTGLFFLVLLAIVTYFYVGRIPNWFFIAILGSFLFVPFLNERAKEGADLFLVSDEPFKLTEYRIGKNVGLEIDGIGTRMQSDTGVSRIILQSIDRETLKAKGSAFGSMTPIDQIRDLTTLQKLTDMLENTLKESRISA